MSHVSVHDVAAYLLSKRSPMTAMKLQKLVYYAQAWSLVWDDEPLFQEPIQAWANGPVVYELYDAHRGQFKVHHPWSHGAAGVLDASQRETVDLVLQTYGDMASQVLSDLTHREDPWRKARKGLAPGERGSQEITHAAMAEYYSSLLD